MNMIIYENQKKKYQIQKKSELYQPAILNN